MASKWTSLFKEKSYSKRRSSTYQSGSKKQFSSILEKMNKKKPSFTVQFDESAIDNGEKVHLDVDKSPMRLRKRSQSLPVNKFNSKFIFVNREKGKLRL